MCHSRNIACERFRSGGLIFATDTFVILVALCRYCAERVLYEIASRRSVDTVLEWRWDNVLNTPTVVRYLIRNLEGRVIESYCLLLCSQCIVLCVAVDFAGGSLLFRVRYR